MTLWNLLDTAGGFAVRTSLQGAALIAAVLLIRYLLRRRLGPGWSFALWFLVLLRLSAPILPSSPWSWQQLGDFLPSSSMVMSRPASEPKEASFLGGTFPADVPTVTNALSALPPYATSNEPGAYRPVTPPTKPTPAADGGAWTYDRAWGSIWATVSLLLLARQIFGSWTFRRQLRRQPLLSDERLNGLIRQCRQRMGVTRQVEFRIVSNVENPCLFGVFRPVILLPTGLLKALSDEEWSSILLHEFGHLKRRDPLWNGWMSFVGCLHWFNPMVWWAARCMRDDREVACDALVLARADGSLRQSYGATLLKLASSQASMFVQPAAMVGILENGGPLKMRLIALRARPSFWLNTILGVVVVSILSACALTSRQVAGVSSPIQAIPLHRHTDYPQAADAPDSLQTFRDDPGMWSQIPKGQQTILGVPFDISGLIRLAGLSPQREEWYFRPEVRGIAVNSTFERLYLLHATYYYAEPGKVIAVARLHYADGTTSDLPIKYGDHSLNYWRMRYERRSHPSDSDSRIAWTGDGSMLAEYGNSLRLCVSSFINPHPGSMVRGIDLISTWQDPSEVVVGMAVGGSVLPSGWRETPPVQIPTEKWTSHLRFRAVDSKTGEAIPGMKLRLEVAEDGVHSRIGTYTTDRNGRADLHYPHPQLRYLSIWADHERYAPKSIQWTPRQHGAYPAEYLYQAEVGERIHGVVEDTTGTPVAGDIVRIDGPSPDFAGDAKEFLILTHATAITDAKGHWSVSVIPRQLGAEQIRLQVLHPHFSNSSIKTLSPPERAGDEIRSQLSPGTLITGKVVNSLQLPLPGTRVMAVSSYPHIGVQLATTDAQGAFSLRLSPGAINQNLLIQSLDYAPLIRNVAQETNLHSISPIVLLPGNTVDVLVKDPQLHPIAGALVEGVLGENRHALNQYLTTDTEGMVRWPHAPDSKDKLMFQVSASGFKTSLTRVPVGMRQIEVHLIPLDVLAGSATDAKTGQPISYFKVWRGRRTPGIASTQWERSAMAIGREGGFQISNDAPDIDTLVFRIEAPNYTPSAELPSASLRGQKPLNIPLQGLKN